MRKAAVLGLAAALSASSGPVWGSQPVRGSRAALKGRPGLRLLRVPKTRQATDYTCGAAALQAVLAFFGQEFREDELSKELGADPEQGTDFRRMAETAQARGLKVSVKKGAGLADLKAALDQGSPAILSLQAWADAPTDYGQGWKDGHYVVAIGYDAKNFYFMDPSLLGHYGYISAAELTARWHDEESPGERISGLMLVFSGRLAEEDPEAILPIE
ncbi:MAG: C39 family peptidase [Elusimicrobia bacterium]|nr:C39 family peptidase [Elusimicrobiota bacterium]